MGKLWFDDLIKIMKFVISKHHVRGDFSSESPNYASATHAAEFVQGAVPLGMTRIFVGNNKNSAGYYLNEEKYTAINP